MSPPPRELLLVVAGKNQPKTPQFSHCHNFKHHGYLTITAPVPLTSLVAKVLWSDDNDTATVSSEGVATVKATNAKSSKMSQQSGDEIMTIETLKKAVKTRVSQMATADSLSYEDNTSKFHLGSTFRQFTCLLDYIDPKSLRQDVSRVLEICASTDDLSRPPKARAKIIVNLFLDYDVQTPLPDGQFPAEFDLLNDHEENRRTFFLCKKPENRLKRMVKSFRKKLERAAVLKVDRKLAEAMVSYLMVSLLRESEEENDSANENGLVRLSEVRADGTGGTMFSGSYYEDKIKKIIQGIKLKGNFATELQGVVFDYIRPTPEGRRVAVPDGSLGPMMTNQNTGSGLSELTPVSFPKRCNSCPSDATLLRHRGCSNHHCSKLRRDSPLA